MTYAERCFERARAAGRKSWVQPDGSMKIASDSEPGVARRVTFEEYAGMVRFHCDCPGGGFQARELVPCKHAARAALRLEREGMAAMRHGQVYVADHLMPKLDVDEPSPLAGLYGKEP